MTKRSIAPLDFVEDAATVDGRNAVRGDAPWLRRDAAASPAASDPAAARVRCPAGAFRPTAVARGELLPPPGRDVRRPADEVGDAPDVEPPGVDPARVCGAGPRGAVAGGAASWLGDDVVCVSVGSGTVGVVTGSFGTEGVLSDGVVRLGVLSCGVVTGPTLADGTVADGTVVDGTVADGAVTVDTDTVGVVIESPLPRAAALGGAFEATSAAHPARTIRRERFIVPRARTCPPYPIGTGRWRLHPWPPCDQDSTGGAILDTVRPGRIRPPPGSSQVIGQSADPEKLRVLGAR